MMRRNPGDIRADRRPRDRDQEVPRLKASSRQRAGDNWLEVFRPNVRMALFVGIGIFFVQQFVVFNAFIYVAPAQHF